MKTLSFCARRRNVAYKVVHFIGKQNFLATTPNVKQKKKILTPRVTELFILYRTYHSRVEVGGSTKLCNHFLFACMRRSAIHKGHIAYHAPVFLGHQTKQFTSWTSFPCGCIVGLISAFILLFLWVLQA